MKDVSYLMIYDGFRWFKNGIFCKNSETFMLNPSYSAVMRKNGFAN